MGHSQPPMLIHWDNSTAVGIANNTVKWQRSYSMEMRFFWVADAVKQGKFNIKYYPGKENLADYQSKHHFGAHHTAVRPWYLNELTSVCELPRAGEPSTLKGCVGTLPDGCIRNSTLPRVPTKQSAPPGGKCLQPYFEIPVLIPTLRRVIGPAIARV
jgi:hypothetical protein